MLGAAQACESDLIQRAFYPSAAPVQHMGVDHRGGHIGVAEQFLHGADVVAAFEQVGGEGVAQRVHRNMAGDAGSLHRIAQRPLQALFVQVMPPAHARTGIDRERRRWPHPEPWSGLRCTRVFAREGLGHLHSGNLVRAVLRP